MPYWGSRDEAVDDFDGYDPTPYSGGYDISLTYGRPLHPSDDICYPVSGTGEVDFERPHYSSGSQTSTYEANNVRKGDCYGILRPGFPLPRQPETNTGYPGYGYPSHGCEGVGGAGFAGVSDYGSGHGQRPQPQEYGSAYYGSGYDGRPQHQEQGSFPSGYGRQEEFSGYGSGGYPRSEQKVCGQQGYGGSEYQKSGEEVGGGYMRHGDYVYEGNSRSERPKYGVSEESSVYKNLGYGQEESGRYTNPSYGDEKQRVGYMKPSYYGGKEGEEYGSSKYGNDSDEEEKKHRYKEHHHRHHYDD